MSLPNQNQPMIHPPGLVATVYPTFFNTAAYGGFTNCFTFMVGFDDAFIASLGVKALRPEDLGWLTFKTKDDWISVVSSYFDPQLPQAQLASTAERLGACSGPAGGLFFFQISPDSSDPSGIHWKPPCVPAICFPKIEGAADYHWAVYNGNYWLEQAGRGGPINVWATSDALIEAVYGRRGPDGTVLYVRDSHFFFQKRIE